ncbi:unnamed protein product [Scytosiphon promiscuus]
MCLVSLHGWSIIDSHTSPIRGSTCRTSGFPKLTRLQRNAASRGGRQARTANMRRPQEPLPFITVVKDPPVLACDHAEGLINGDDRPFHICDRVLNRAVLHKCASEFVSHLLGSSRRRTASG